MPGFDHQILTDVGWDALADALSNKKLAFIHLEAGDGEVTGGDAEMQGMTQLIHYIMDFPITSFSDDGQGQVTLIGTLTSKNVTTGFYFREVGVKATIDAGTELLYSVANSGAEANYIPSSTETSTVTQTLEIIVKIDRAQNVTINVQAGTNTVAQNIGPATVGPGWYRDKIGSTLNFKRLIGTGAVKTSETTDTVTVDVTIPTVVPSGGIIEFGGITIPSGWFWCDGSAKSRTTYPTLYAAIGTRWGAGDGSTTFNVPDSRGRVGMGTGQGAGLTNRVLGTYGGVETVALTVAQMPYHNHTASGGNHNHGIYDPSHAHSIYDPTHNHYVWLGDPGHAHGVADPQHTHAYVYGNWTPDQGAAAGGTGYNNFWGDVQRSSTGIGIYGAGTGMGVGMNPAATNIGIYGAYTGIQTYGATVPVYVDAAGGNQAHTNIQPHYVATKIIKI